MTDEKLPVEDSPSEEEEEKTTQAPATRSTKRGRPQESILKTDFPSQPFPAQQQPPTQRNLKKSQLRATTLTLDRLGIAREHPPRNIRTPCTGPPGLPLPGANIREDFHSDQVKVTPMVALPYQRAARLSNKSVLAMAHYKIYEI